MQSTTKLILAGLVSLTVLGFLFYNRNELTCGSINISAIQPTINIFTSRLKGVKKFVSACNGKPTIVNNSSLFNLTEVITSCTSFLDRVREYNEALGVIRNETLRSRIPEQWHGPTEGAIDVVWGANDDYLEQLGKYPEVRTVSLPWMGTVSNNWSSLVDKSNMLIQNYYEWAASDQLCRGIETGAINLKYDVHFNRTCNRYIDNTVRPQSLKPVYLHAKPIARHLYWPNNGTMYPARFFQGPTPYVFYLHVLTDAIVTGWGDVYTKRVKLVPYACSDARDPNVPPSAKNQLVYDEIFVIAQYWGTAWYHRMGEIIPRMIGWLDFLKSNPQIKIFAPEAKGGRLAEIMKILGLDPDRLTTEWGRAKVAYVPRASYCGMPNLQESQIASLIYRTYIENTLGPYTRNTLLLIRRSGSRRFTQQEQIEKVVERLAKEHGLTYRMFIDNPVPPFHETMRMFHSAVMVVAPHGAGLANLFFSQPGTYVIEGVCNLSVMNLCFQRLAIILGHHYHAIPGRGGCEGVVDVPAEDIEITVSTYLKLYSLARKNA